MALGVYPLPHALPRELSAALRDKLAELRKRLPEGVDFSLDFDFTLSLESPERPTTFGYLLVKPGSPDGDSPERVPEFLEQSAEVLMKSVGVQHVLALSEDPFARLPATGPVSWRCWTGSRPGGRKTWIPSAATWDRWRRGAGASLRPVGAGPPPGGRLPHRLCHFRPRMVDEVEEFGRELVQRLAQDPQLTDLAAGPGTSGHRLLYMDVDRTAAKVAGVSLADISDMLQAYLGSVHVNAFNAFGRTWKVQVQARDAGP